MIKILVIVVFIFIIASLGTALFHLIKSQDSAHSAKTVKALTYRISISVLLFIILFLAVASGILKPQGIGANIQRFKQTQSKNSTVP